MTPDLNEAELSKFGGSIKSYASRQSKLSCNTASLLTKSSVQSRNTRASSTLQQVDVKSSLSRKQPAKRKPRTKEELRKIIKLKAYKAFLDDQKRNKASPEKTCEDEIREAFKLKEEAQVDEMTYIDDKSITPSMLL